MTTVLNQTQYVYLKKEKSPKVLVNALNLLGVKEIVGPRHNKQIMEWATELGLSRIYTSDEIPWCGLFIAKVVKDSDYEVVKDPLWARNWANFGNKQTEAMLGDILVFTRGGGGHVGIYVGEDAACYHVLGGNQGNMVNISRIEKSRCISINRSPWKIGQPANVRPIKLKVINGIISKNEA